MPIKSDLKYNLIYAKTSFQSNPELLEDLKKECPYVEHPFLDSSILPTEMKETFDSYLYIEDTEEFGERYREIEVKFPSLDCTLLGVLEGEDILGSLNSCEDMTIDNIQTGKFFKVTQGRFKNLEVQIVRVFPDEKAVIGEYVLIDRGKYIKLPFSRIEEIPPTKLDPANDFIDYKTSSFKSGKKNAIVIDGSWVVYRSMTSSNYSTVYTGTGTKRFVGGAQGFYFHLLKTKQMYPEYEVHVVFGSEIAENKKNEQHKKFWRNYKTNSDWSKELVKSLGFSLYDIDKPHGLEVIGSLATRLSRKYSSVIINSINKNFYALVKKNVKVLTFKENFRGYPLTIGMKEIDATFKVNKVEKVNWVRALQGDPRNNIISINTWNNNREKTKAVKHSDYIGYVNRAKTYKEFKESLKENPKFTNFCKSQLDKNFKSFKIQTDLFKGKDLNIYAYTLEEDNFEYLLEENLFVRELEMKTKVLRIFKGIW